MTVTLGYNMFFFSCRVTVKNGIVTMANIKGRSLAFDTERIFKTSRVSKHVFTDISWNSVSFPEFFALEMYHILDDIENSGDRWIRTRDIRDLKNALVEETWIGDIFKTFPTILDRSKLKEFIFDPKDYQDEFFDFYDKTVQRFHLNGLLLAAGVGTGKTFSSLALAEMLGSDTIVVVCPKNAYNRVWLNSTCGEGCVYKTKQSAWAVADGKPYKGEKIVIFHYEAIKEALELVGKLKRGKVTVILDESHFFNETTSVRSDLFNQLCKKLETKHVIHATGTPIKALSVEAIPLLRAIDPLFTEDVERRFKKMFAGEATHTTSILSRRLNMISFHVDKARIGLEEPEESTIKIKIPNGKDFTLPHIAYEMALYVDERTAHYKQLRPIAREFFFKVINDVEAKLIKASANSREEKHWKDRFTDYLNSLEIVIGASNHGGLRGAVTDMALCTKFEKQVIIPNIDDKDTRDKFKDYKSVVKYPQLKVRGECLGRVLGRKRIDAHVEMAKHINYYDIIQSTDKKTVVFTSFTEVIEAALPVIKEAGYKPLAVYGKFTASLSPIVAEFEKNEAANPLLTTYAALSTAVPLVMADTMIIINMPFRDYILEQTIGRIHRQGATTKVRIINTELDTGDVPNISSRTTDILKWSREQVDAIFGTKGDSSVFDSVDDVEAPEAESLGFSMEEIAIPNLLEPVCVTAGYSKW